MAEIFASRVQQVLNYLELKDKSAIEDEVNGLVRVLEKIEDLWTNAHSSERVSDNMQRLREFAYDIEDLLEMWAVQMDAAYMRSKNEKKRGIRRFLKRYVFRPYDGMTIRKIGTDMLFLAFVGNSYIECFHEMVPDDHAMESACSVDEEQSMADWRNVSWPRQTYAHDGMEEHFVGMEKDLEQLISLVTGDDHKYIVVSIWGVEGSGKTTLARKVYTDVEVKNRFNAFAWVTLSQGFQFRNVLQGMLMQLGGGAVKKSTAADQNKMNENMIDQLKEVQRQKRCFIVVDGISDMNQWKDVSSAFLLTEEGTNTRVLITTHLETIATSAGSPYQLNLLSEDEGWELLKKYAFRHEAEAPTSGVIPKFGREMVGKCGNLPSAICSVGRILSKTPLSEWHMVNNDITGYLERDDQSQSYERSADVSHSNNYDHLPYGLKQCFLYLGIFKENEELDSEDLTLLWMAEGMLSPQGIMDTAEQYIRKLAAGNLLQVQVDEFSANRRFMPLCLRNHQRELSLYEGKKEDFRLKVMDFSDGKQPRFDPFTLFTRSDGIRRLVIHFNKLVSSPPQARELVASFHLRSLFFLNSDENECVDLPVRINDFKEFKVLRVLHFVRCKFKDRKLPEGIEKLNYLRYFGILYCDLDELPPSISNFRHLHVLNVRASDDAKIIIPNVLSQMIRLKHLRLPKKLDKKSDKLLELDGLRDLETLVGFNADILDLRSLSRLEKLRLLVIHAYSNSSLIPIINFFKVKRADMRTNLFIEYTCSFTSQEELPILEDVLMCHDLYALTLSLVLIHKFPNCGMHASSGLTQIKLIGCKLSEDPMGALGLFPSLQKLCFGYGAFLGREMAISCTGFPKLEYLEFRCLPNLEEWKVDVGAMPHLSALTVRRCLKLKGIPKELASNNRDSLNNLEIELPPSALADGQEEEYRQMFDFVTSLSIRKLDPLSSSSEDSHH
ncbi:hypothetical protein C2S51_026290 [Perilla frutescens var. frutescens]|nr:hypothetical protein C2S51_026290 [Perilla frutescens var. frutescens]